MEAETNKQVASVLGQDPVSPPEAQEPEAEAPPVQETPAEPAAPTGNEKMSVDGKEYLVLREKAGLFNIIENEPELHAQVVDYIAKKNKAGKPSTASTAAATPELEQIRQEHAKMKEALQVMAAQEAIREFKSRTPDFDTYRPRMAELLQKHPSLSMDEAYEFAKRTAQPAPSSGTQPSQPRLKTPETRGTGPSKDADLDKIVERINNPKATPRTDDYIDAAFEAARRKYNSSAGI